MKIKIKSLSSQLRFKTLFYIFSSALFLQFFSNSDSSFSGIIDQYFLEETEREFVVGELQFIESYSPTRVSVIDPLIADIEKVTEKEITIIAKSPGTTTLTIWDNLGKRTVLLRVYAEDMVRLKDRLDKLLSHIKISNLDVQISPEESKIIVTGEIYTEDEDRLKSILDPFVDKIINLIKTKEETALVEIDTQVLELSTSATEALGIDWMTTFQVREEPYQVGSTTQNAPVTLNRTAGSFSYLFNVESYARDALSAQLNMLITEGKGRVLSRPRLVCLSGKEASFIVGGQVPIVTEEIGTQGTSQLNVEYRDYGIILKIVPIVRDDKIDTTINTEVSTVDFTTNYVSTSTGIRIPAFATRSASTQLYLKDGQTVFIAGLIKNEESKNINKVPALGNVPILGALFRSKEFQDNRTELVISLTPRIIRSEQEAKTSTSSAQEPAVNQARAESFYDNTALTQKVPQDLYSYIRSVQAKIAQVVQYPREAKEARIEGITVLRIHLFSDGNLDKATIKESSGYLFFDNAALKAAQSQTPYPAFPAEITQKDLWIDIPIVYNLES